jgi:two-component system chemotaxis response regulator CheB
MRRDVVVIGGSAGSHKPLMQALARLPSDLPAMVLVALRIAPGARAELADALVKSCVLPAVDGVRFDRFRIDRFDVQLTPVPQLLIEGIPL